MAQDDFNFGQLTKEMVTNRLKEVHDAPTVAAEIARKTIVAGVQGTRASGQSPQETVTQIVKGAMSGLLLIDKYLSPRPPGPIGAGAPPRYNVARACGNGRTFLGTNPYRRHHAPK